MKNDDGKIAKLLSVVDLTDLEPARRVSLIGHDHFIERRKFLKSLAGTGVVLGLPFLTSCSKSDNNPLASKNKDFPTIKRTTPTNNSAALLDDDQSVEIKIIFDHQMDETSIANSIEITPAPTGTVKITTVNDAANTAEPCIVTISTQNDRCTLAYEQNYTITVKGTAKDKKGKFLDGNLDGSSGDDFLLTFTTAAKPAWPKVLNTSPTAGSIVALTSEEMYGVEIYFNKVMDRDSVTAAISISPEPPGGIVVASGPTNGDPKGAYKSYIWSPDSGSLHVVPGTEYTVTIKGTAKDTEGHSLDGNDDGTNKDDYVFKFSPKYLPPVVKSTTPVDGSMVTLDCKDCFPIRIVFDKDMDLDSIKKALAFSPAPVNFEEMRIVEKSGVYELQLYSLFWEVMNYVCKFNRGTKYTLTIKGTAKDKHGNFLDANNDGVGGDDFVLQFTTDTKCFDTCPCVYNVCSCVGNTCSCVGDSCPSDIGLGCPLHGCPAFFCDCQFAGCPAHII